MSLSTPQRLPLPTYTYTYIHAHKRPHPFHFGNDWNRRLSFLLHSQCLLLLFVVLGRSKLLSYVPGQKQVHKTLGAQKDKRLVLTEDTCWRKTLQLFRNLGPFETHASTHAQTHTEFCHCCKVPTRRNVRWLALFLFSHTRSCHGSKYVELAVLLPPSPSPLNNALRCWHAMELLDFWFPLMCVNVKQRSTRPVWMSLRNVISYM